MTLRAGARRALPSPQPPRRRDRGRRATLAGRDAAALLPDDEIDALRALRGAVVAAVASDGWAVHVRAGAASTLFVPVEHALPDAAHPHGDVVRVGVAPDPTRCRSGAVLRADAGVVLRIELLQVGVALSPPHVADAVDIGGVTIPAGIAYGPLYFAVDDAEVARLAAAHHAVTRVDVAVRLTCARDDIVVGVDGAGFHVYTSLTDEGRARLAVWASAATARLVA